LETIEEEEEIKQKKPKIKEWTEEDEEEMGNIVEPYYKM